MHAITGTGTMVGLEAALLGGACFLHWPRFRILGRRSTSRSDGDCAGPRPLKRRRRRRRVSHLSTVRSRSLSVEHGVRAFA